MPTETLPPPASAPASAAPPVSSAELRPADLGQPSERAATPPKPGSARAAMFEKLKEVSAKGDAREQARAARPQPEPPKPAEKHTTAKAGEKTTAAAPASEKPAEAAAAAAADPKEKGKVNPWKLVDEYKAKLATAEARVLETEKRAVPEADWKKTQETLTQREKRLNELEEEIRYVNYSKSEEFKTKYQQPYEKQWQRTMSELGELTVETADGGTRPLAANDILDLVNAPLGKAHEMAVERFGDLAPEVMAHRKEIRKLFDEQSSALEEARKNGAEREKTNSEKQQREYGEMSTGIKETWSKANEEITADPKHGVHFTPIEGDQEGNLRLAKGFELADRAFSENPLANGLSNEQRQAIVRRHAAVRNRAAAFGRLTYQNAQAKARIADLEKQLAEYKGSEPPAGGTLPTKNGGEKQTGMGRLMGELRKLAK